MKRITTFAIGTLLYINSYAQIWGGDPLVNTIVNENKNKFQIEEVEKNRTYSLQVSLNGVNSKLKIYTKPKKYRWKWKYITRESIDKIILYMNTDKKGNPDRFTTKYIDLKGDGLDETDNAYKFINDEFIKVKITKQNIINYTEHIDDINKIMSKHIK